MLFINSAINQQPPHRIEAPMPDNHVLTEKEHPDHPAHVDYHHYHKDFDRPPVRCYLCRRIVSHPRSWFLVTPTNVLHVICSQCETNLVNIKHLDRHQPEVLGFPADRHPDHDYFIDPYDLEQIS